MNKSKKAEREIGANKLLANNIHSVTGEEAKILGGKLAQDHVVNN